MDPNPLLPTVGDAVATIVFVLVSLLLLAGVAWSVVVAARMITVLRDARRDPLNADPRVLARTGRLPEARLAEAPVLDRRVLVTADASAWLYVVVTGATGLALFAVSSALGAIGWAFVELPGAENNLLREALPWRCSHSRVRRPVDRGRRDHRSPAGDGPSEVDVPDGGGRAECSGLRACRRGGGTVLRPLHSGPASAGPRRCLVVEHHGINGIVILLVAVAFSGAGLVALALGRVPAAAPS